MKILDRYIALTFLKTFINVFVILMFIFVLQTIWLYISELAGKDLDLLVIGKFVLYFSPRIVPLVLPLTILLASLMVFGSLAENYEFAAMKSTGISLQRAMRGLGIFVVILGIGVFFFSNYAIPWSEYKFHNLRRNLAKVKPTLAIVEGQFNEVGDSNIRVLKKEGDNEEFLKEVVIHKSNPKKRGNYIVIVADSGKINSPKDSDILQLELFTGYYYEELINSNKKKKNDNPHAHSYFDRYVINMDLSNLDVDLDQKVLDDKFNMLTVPKLKGRIDSLNISFDKQKRNYTKSMYNRSYITSLANNYHPNKDSIYNGDVLSLFSKKEKIRILKEGLRTIKSSINVISTNKKTFKRREININRHIISLHDKFALSVACIILFFVGAPLGALIRKGGIGLPLVIAMLLFLSYHFIGIFAKNSSKDGSLDPIVGTWLSSLIMLPLGVYFTIRATKDLGIIDMDSILLPLKKAFGSAQRRIHIPSTEEGRTIYGQLANLPNEKLVDILSKPDQLGIEKQKKEIAIMLLDQKKIYPLDMSKMGYKVPQLTEKIHELTQTVLKKANLSLKLYFGGALLLLGYFILKNNKLETPGKISLLIGIGIFIYFVITFIRQTSLYNKLLELSKSKTHIGIPKIILYILIYPIHYMYVTYKSRQAYFKNFYSH